MPSAPVTPNGRAGCTACPILSGGETSTPGSNKSMPGYSCDSVGRGRSLGDAVRSVRGSLRGRRALGTTTNQQPAPLATAVSAGSSPIGPPARKRWFDSLRSRSSHIPTPSSPTSMSSTLKRSRFFRPSPAQAPAHGLSLSAGQDDQLSRAVLPTLELSSFQSELQRLSIFGTASEKSCLRDTNPKSENIAPKKTSDVKKMLPTETMPLMPGVNPAAAVMRPALPAPVACSETGLKPDMSPVAVEVKISKPKVAFVNGEPATIEPVNTHTSKKPEDEWRTLCALYYKGSPWQQDRIQVFPDASSALSHVALHSMLGDRTRRCSNVLLWTGEIAYTTPRTKQTLTIYPHYEGPRRIEIEEKYCLEWAFLAFTSDPKSTQLPPMEGRDLGEEDPRLMAAIQTVSERGYHVDVWTCRDSEEWDFDIDSVRVYDIKKAAAERLQDPERLKRRARYEAFIRHGVSGFSRDDINFLDDILERELQGDQHIERENDYDYADDGYELQVDGTQKSAPRTEPELEFNGFLEHQEETIIEDEADGNVEHSKNAETSSLSTLD